MLPLPLDALLQLGVLNADPSGTTVCTANGANYVRAVTTITSRTVEEETGDLLDVRALGVTVGAEGVLTDDCATLAAGGSELPGGYALAVHPRIERVAPPGAVVHVP